ncbi:intraflagellar transport protein 57 homolog [Teleopsis dalmanni]|uniref:intraflagellar transport protein 57 homolog n=1 Tax=Teleopsis dalmanni TaxID=139649 RepID=UPI0018CEF89D|nr:intraflagellar transport protein 57 homolog [Teleopsis dalmanni]
MEEDLASAQDKNDSANATYKSDDLLEKLKLLNYESQLLKEFKMKPISRYYFVKSFNPGEQFYMFTLICWWLCKKLGKDMERPQEYDDPNTVIAKIVQILEEIDISVEFPPNKLIRGAGPICLLVLDNLATQVLKVAKISCEHLQIAQEEEHATEYLEDNAEIILEKLEDEQNAGGSDDSDMEVDKNHFKNFNWINNIARSRDSNNILTEAQTHVTEHLTDKEEWRLEFERVLPQLKVFVKSDARDWRSHLSQIETFKTNIDEIAEETQNQLKKLHGDFTFSIDKVESREKHLNNELQTLISEYKEVSIELSKLQYAQTKVESDSANLLTQLNDVIAENDIKKAEMERRGQSMSDGSSVVQIKKAIAKLKDEIAHLSLEVALLVNGIDQDIMRQAGRIGDIEVSNTRAF